MGNFVRFIGRSFLAAVLFTGAFARGQSEAEVRRAAIEGLYPIMLGALEARSFARARNICEQAILWEPQNPTHHYNLACIEAQAGGARLPYAWGPLELAIALGFNDARHMQADPDLAPLREDSRFADLVGKVVLKTSGIGSGGVGFSPKTSPLPSGSNSSGSPLKSAPTSNSPVGLFAMTRYLPSAQTLEREAWYFAADGRVFRGLETGVTEADLSGHAKLRGTLAQNGSELEIVWTDGSMSAAKLERDGSGFTWDMGIFLPAKPFADTDEVPGTYEAAEFTSDTRSGLAIPQRLELDRDGAFRWTGVTLSSGPEGLAQIVNAPDVVTTGRWSLDGASLVLISAEGLELRRIAFPQDDEKTVIRPDKLFFGGIVYKRRP